MDLSRPTLAKMFPRAIPEWLDALAKLAPELCNRYQITTARRWVHFCGQVVAETGGLSIPHMRESFAYSPDRLAAVFGSRVVPNQVALCAAGRDAIAECVYGLGNRVGRSLGNDQPGDGAKYIGRGIMQTTGKANYKKVGDEIGVDLIADPDLLETPEIGVRAAFADWNDMGVNALADTDDVRSVTKRVNGGYNGLDMRQSATERAKSIWGNGMVAEPFDLQTPAPVAPLPVPTVPVPTLPPANDPVPPPIIAPIPPPAITPHDLVKGGSRTARMIRWLKGLIGLGGTTAGVGILNPGIITQAQDTTHAINGFLHDTVALAVIGGGCGVLFVVLLAAEHFHVMAAINGRYVPAGWMADVTGAVGDVVDLTYGDGVSAA